MTLLLLLLLGGCSTYQNITGYFNTYYNARKAFGEAVDAAELTRVKGRDTLYIAPYKLDPAAVAKFDKVIEKCSKLIEFYDKSDWVDDAIVMIGKSYVYEDENDAAIRKFKELFDNFPGSGLTNDAKLWTAKALYFSGKDDEALRAVKELFPEARTEGQNDIMLETLILEAQIYAQRNDYTQAAQTYALASQVEGSDALRSVAQYQAALAFEKMGQYQEAATAYAGVRKLSPPFDMEFKARIGEGRMLALEGRYEQALKQFDALFDEPLKVEERAAVDLEIANTDWMMGDSSAAFDLFTHIDTTYRKSDASAKAQLKRAQIFERELRDYRKAREFYDKAKAEFSPSEATQPALVRGQTFAAYFTHYDDLHRYDSMLLKRLELDSIEALRALEVSTHADSLNGASGGPAAGGDTLRTAALHRDTSSSAAVAAAAPPQAQPAPAPPAAAQVAETPDTARTAARTAADEGDDEDRDRPLGRRRQSGGTLPAPVQRAVTRLPKDLIAERERQDERRTARGDSARAGGTAAAKPAPAPPAALSADSLRSLMARTCFEMSGIFMLELQRPDSAERWFSLLLTRFPASHYTPRALYAMAELRRTRGDTVAVDSLYDLILARYGTSEYADQIRRLRGLATRTAAVDSTAEEFAATFALLDSGRTGDAVAQLQDLVARHPGSPSAPKAAYTIGWIYENVLVQLDSAAAWYERLTAAYPSSEYAAAVAPKLAVKKDPKSLSKYVNVREIQAVARPGGPPRRSREGTLPKTGEGDDEEVRQGRGKTQGVDSEEDQGDEDEAEPPADSDDDSGDDDNN